MANLIRKLDAYDPHWRETVSPDPVEAAIELGMLDAEDADDEEYQPLDFND
jgi:hypothetical protein